MHCSRLSRNESPGPDIELGTTEFRRRNEIKYIHDRSFDSGQMGIGQK